MRIKFESQHLNEVDQDYVSHAKDALKISFDMMVASMKMLVHAFSPDTFKTAATDVSKNIIKMSESKKAGGESESVDDPSAATPPAQAEAGET